MGKDKFWGSNNAKLLGVKIDNKSKFAEHISKICLKSNRILQVLSQNYQDFFP